MNPIGWWIPGREKPKTGDEAIRSAVLNVSRPVYVLSSSDGIAVAQDGIAAIGDPSTSDANGYPLMGYIPGLHPADFGDPAFKKAHHIRYPYVAGAMANGITSVEMVIAAGKAGMIGFFGAAGLDLKRIEDAIDRLQEALPGRPYGFNLIHSPNEPGHELATVALYLNREIRCISASAFLQITLPLVYYRVKGIHRATDGEIVCPNRVVAKVSRIEVAEKFFSPPPKKIVAELVNQGMISREEAELAEQIPMAEDLTAEADSGGHTDNRPALTLLPTMLSLKNQLSEKFGYGRNLRVGLGGGIATPESTAAAFAMGAAYVLTGSVNQACVEAGTSETVRRMLAQASQADVAMAPAADMFEMGVKVQVLKRGTMFAVRAAKLYDLYRRYESYEEIPDTQKSILERDFFRDGFSVEWDRTRAFFEKRDPGQIQRAHQNPRHKLALVFRSYLGQSSKWAVSGETTRQMDYQVWCGPAMGAFNQWVRGTFLEPPENRRTVTIAKNLLLGASVVTRFSGLRNQGLPLSGKTVRFLPLPLSKIETYLGDPG